MKTKWTVMFIAVLLIFSGCNGQTIKKEKNKQEQDTAIKSENSPQENISVNKEFDESGNLIRYDSTYTYYYSNIEGNENLADSVLNNFRNMFLKTYPFSTKPYFDNLFFEDSLLQYDFYKKDFFYNRFRQNMQKMDKMFLEMDSIKNLFFIEQFPKDKR